MRHAIVHVADIHYRKEEPEGSSSIINVFLDDLESQLKALDGYSLHMAITGDIVQAGNDNESYSKFLKEFDKKFYKIGLKKANRFMVPGNHDIDREVVKANLCTMEQDKRLFKDERLFNDLVDKSGLHKGKFENYKLFESDFSKYGIDFIPAGKGWEVNDDLGVYCLNTAICSFGGVNKIDDKGNLAVCTRGLTRWCSSRKTSTNVLLMHHPFSHLNQWSKDELKQIVENNFTLCLCGHDHEQDIYYNKISRKSIVCSAPQLFTKKEDNLGYGIICIEDGLVEKIIYRQYVKGAFLNGQMFAENNEGIVVIDSQHKKNIQELESNLESSLAFFKGHTNVFVEPKLALEREFNEEKNLLEDIIKSPGFYVITAQPQFGLTSLSHYMRLEAYKNDNFWIYVNSKHVKARQVINEVSLQTKRFEKKESDIKCIIIDSWKSDDIDHVNIAKTISATYDKTPIIVMSNYRETYYSSMFDFAKINEKFQIIHLQALERNKVRELVVKCNGTQNGEKEDSLVSMLLRDLEALNIHRTPLNCLTLLKVFDNNYSGDLINRTKLIKTVLTILFSDAESFFYSSSKPNIDDCEIILGHFCASLVKNHRRMFKVSEINESLNQYCEDNYLNVEVELIVHVLLDNNILLRFNDYYEFKHSYWIFYFASAYMMQNKEFESFILDNKQYVNYPEIIEFYTGQDGRRTKAIETLLEDLKTLITIVDNKIGIKGKLNPLKGVVWNPSGQEVRGEAVRKIKDDISERVQDSNLPNVLKDQHADESYNSEAPYDQSINQFMNDYSVLSLTQAIRASSKALRNSNHVDKELKIELIDAIFKSWEQVSKVLFCISPTLAKDGSACFDGMNVVLADDFDEIEKDKLKSIYLANPNNVVFYFKDHLSSQKIGPLVYQNLSKNSSELQALLILHFLISEKPNGWNQIVFDFMNLLHRSSFFLGSVFKAINYQLAYGFLSQEEEAKLNLLKLIVRAKHRTRPKKVPRTIPDNMTISTNNKLPLDKIIAKSKGPEKKNNRKNK